VRCGVVTIVQARPHKGQMRAARNLRSLLLLPSTIQDSHKNCGQVQDSYSLRCIPQVNHQLPS
jgi:histidine ammonia-lyase